MKNIQFKDTWPCPCGSKKKFSLCCKKRSNASNTINYLLATIKTCTKDSKNSASNGFWNSHNDNVLKNNQVERCIKLTQNHHQYLKKYPLLTNKYDLILSVNVVTQLLRPFFDTFIESCIIIGNLKRWLLLDIFIDNITSIAHEVIPYEHLHFLKSIAKPNAKLLITSPIPRAAASP